MFHSTFYLLLSLHMQHITNDFPMLISHCTPPTLSIYKLHRSTIHQIQNETASHQVEQLAKNTNTTNKQTNNQNYSRNLLDNCNIKQILYFREVIARLVTEWLSNGRPAIFYCSFAFISFFVISCCLLFAFFLFTVWLTLSDENEILLID